MTSVLDGNSHGHTHAENRFGVIPTLERPGADPRRAGRGVTIAFLDTGFRPHPDLADRVVAYHDVTDPGAALRDDTPEEFAWHGTQTSVVGAGDGSLSDGVHRSAAALASVVLVKVRGSSGTHEENTRRGLEWVLANHERLGIRIASLSVGGGDGLPGENPVDRLAGELVRAGVVVVAAAGNSGCTEDHVPLPPATAPSVLTVGGYDDGNRLGEAPPGLYGSSYGVLADGRMKPEVIAPAAWVAAPILPGTEFERRAEALSTLAAAPDYRFARLVETLWPHTGLPDAWRLRPVGEARGAVLDALRSAKIISTHYQHVDGTSFAAPIVASVIAQMLEANPRLAPGTVRRILMQTADRISGQDALRQGFGVVNAARAVEQARRESHEIPTVGAAGSGRSRASSAAAEAQPTDDLAPRRVGRDLVFFYHDHAVTQVELAGEFNGWRPEPMALDDLGNWRVAIPPPSPGRYRYKFRLEGVRWLEDPCNDLREADGFGGMNSILNVV